MATAALERSKTSAPAREYARKLAEQLSFGKSADRAAAARELAGVDSPESVRVLTDALGDPAAGVRAAAARSLEAMRDPATLGALSRMPSRRIRSPLSAVARGSNVPPR
jgi:HEAT repeat protein